MPIMCMAWLQKAGHTPIIVLGGGTAMVGDPSGKDKTREILTPAKIEANLAAMKPLFARFIDFETAKIINNADWLLPLNYVDFLRDIGLEGLTSAANFGKLLTFKFLSISLRLYTLSGPPSIDLRMLGLNLGLIILY